MKNLIVSKENVIYNLIKFQEIARNSRIIAVLKGDGYGLGIGEYLKVLIENGVDFFAVSELEEALKIREFGYDGDLLLLSSTAILEEAYVIVQHNIIATVGGVDSAKALFDSAQKLGLNAKAHVKLDTGFGRFGFLPEDTDELISIVKTYSNIDFCGIYTHLSCSFEKGDKLSTRQFNCFNKVVEKLKKAGVCPEFKHVCNTCATLRFHNMHENAVRIGSGLLGRIPIENVWGLKSVGVLESVVSEVKYLPKGHNVGYGNCYRTKRDTKIAIIPVGYKDGFGTEKSRDTFRFIDVLRYIYGDMKMYHSKKTVKINKQTFNIIGRIGMYNIIVDITNAPVFPGDCVSISCNPILIDSSIPRLWS